MVTILGAVSYLTRVLIYISLIINDVEHVFMCLLAICVSLLYISYMWNLKKKKDYKWTYLQNRNSLTDIESQPVVTKADRGLGKGKLGAWDEHIHAAAAAAAKSLQSCPTIYEINNKDLLCSRGNYTQHLVITCNGKESEKNIQTYLCTTESLLHAWKLAQFCKSTIL